MKTKYTVSGAEYNLGGLVDEVALGELLGRYQTPQGIMTYALDTTDYYTPTPVLIAASGKTYPVSVDDLKKNIALGRMTRLTEVANG